MKRRLKQGRQGDILLVAVDMQPPAWATPGTEMILARGETTGHAHVLTAAQMVTWDADRQRYVAVLGEPGVLTHPEHGARTIPAGSYRVVPQAEFSLEGEWRQVVD